jgi:hypothetical protein
MRDFDALSDGYRQKLEAARTVNDLNQLFADTPEGLEVGQRLLEACEALQASAIDQAITVNLGCRN